MFVLRSVLVLLVALTIYGQAQEINNYGLRQNQQDKGFQFGKLRLSNNGKNEELISSVDISSLSQDQPSNSQPLPSPCSGTRPNTKFAFPKDKTKYVQCRDEFHYEILSCPNGKEYNEQTAQCDIVLTRFDICEQEKPCLNDGQCTVLANSTIKCYCLADWTGERCETPLNSCAKKPCGPNAVCRSLKITENEQDYVCVCHESKYYGRNCQEVAPNPCLSGTEQFYPFAFSLHAYIQCDDEMMHFRPCGSLLYWNQDEQICDRKRKGKLQTPKLVTKLISKNTNDIQQDMVTTTTTTPTTTTTTTESVPQQNGKEGYFAFVPAKLGNRQEYQTQNVQDREQKYTGFSSNDLSQNINGNQIRQDFLSQPNQGYNQQIDSSARQTFPIQSGRNQQWSQNNQQSLMPSTAESSQIDSNVGQSQFRQDNRQRFNQLQNINQRYAAQPQSWQGSQVNSNQIRFPESNQQTFLETATIQQNVIPTPDFQTGNVRQQEQFLQTRPTGQITEKQLQKPVTFNSQDNQNVFSQSSWQNVPRNQNQQQTFETTTAVPTQNFVRPQVYQNQNIRDQSWQNRSPQSVQNSQTFQNSQQQSTSNIPEMKPIDNQDRFSSGFNQMGSEQQNVQSWQNKGNNEIRQNFVPSESSSVINQRTPSFNSQSSSDLNNGQFQKGTQQFSQDNQQQVSGAQQSSNQIQNTNQRFPTQPQSWQGSQMNLNQVRVPDSYQQTFETTTVSQNMNDQIGQNKVVSQPAFGFQPIQWTDTKTRFQQDNILTSQTQNPQTGINQQFQNSDNMRIQQNQVLPPVRPIVSSQNGQFSQNSFETSTVSNKGVFQGLATQDYRGWQQNRPNENSPQEINPIGQETTEKRKVFDSIPTLLSGSWKSKQY